MQNLKKIVPYIFKQYIFKKADVASVIKKNANSHLRIIILMYEKVQ